MLKEFGKQFKKNRAPIIFMLKLLGLFGFLTALYELYIIPHTDLDSKLIAVLISQAETILTVLGYELLEANPVWTSHFGIINTSGVVIGNPCDGLSLFILYVSFIAVFKGKWWFKIGSILFGVAFIHFLNLIRIVALALIVRYYPTWLDFHHSYTFTLIVYASIFFIWYLRINIYQRKRW